jgi:hypothetical protein
VTRIVRLRVLDIVISIYSNIVRLSVQPGRGKCLTGDGLLQCPVTGATHTRVMVNRFSLNMFNENVFTRVSRNTTRSSPLLPIVGGNGRVVPIVPECQLTFMRIVCLPRLIARS